MSIYRPERSYDWNYANAPMPVDLEIPIVPGTWDFLGLHVASPLGVAAGPLLNGDWVLYYASLGFDLLTYKTVRSSARACYSPPNLVPVSTRELSSGQMRGDEKLLKSTFEMAGSWAVSFGMPSMDPTVWRADVERTRDKLDSTKLLSVSCVGTVQPKWGMEELAEDYARCAVWALESGADCVETNFSCPNVSTCDGQIYQQADDAATIAERVRQRIGPNARFLIKVGHFVEPRGVTALLKAVSPFVDAVVTTNSVASAVIDANDAPLFNGNPRGICGAAIREASLHQTRAMTDEIAKSKVIRDSPGARLKVVGVGGIRDASHVLAYLDAGAIAVQLATEVMLDPLVGVRIRNELAHRRSS